MSSRKLVSATVANLLVPLSGLVVSPFLSRELGPGGRGLYAALTLPVVVYGWAGTYGLQDSLSYHLYHGRLTRRGAARVSLVATAPLGLFGIAVLAAVGLGVFAGNHAHYVELLTLTLLAPAHLLANLLIGALTGASDIRGVNLVKVVPAAVRTALLVFACVAFDLSAYWAGLLFLASMLPAVVIGVVRLRTAPPGSSRPEAAAAAGPPAGEAPDIPTRSLVRYALRCLPGVLAAISSARLDQIVGLPVIGARQLGYYAAAVSGAEIPMAIATAARTVLMGRPSTADPREATAVARLSVLASVVACGLLAAASPVAVPWFFGSDFAPAVEPAAILCAATVLYTGVVLLSAALLVGGRAGASSASLVAGSAVGVALLFLLAPWGATGAAVASLGGYGVSVGGAALAIRRTRHVYSLRMLMIPYLADVRHLRDRVRAVVGSLRALGGGADDGGAAGGGAAGGGAAGGGSATAGPAGRVIAWVRRQGLGTVGTGTLIVLAWLRILAPALIQTLTSGRPKFNALNAPVPAAVNAAGNAISLAFLLVAVVLAVSGLRGYRTARLRWLAVAVAPLVAIVASGLADHEHPDIVWLALPLAAVAIWLQPPSTRVFPLLGVLAAVTAAGSMLLAAIRPDLGLLTGADAGSKGGLLGGLLAGPYPHSNVLGIALALGLPFVFGIPRAAARWGCLTVVLFAVVWTGARSSQFAVAVVVVAYLLMRLWPERKWPAGVLVAAGVALIVVVPLVTRDPASFTNRGQIWRALLHRWTQRPVVGFGPDFFDRTPDLAKALGGQFTHGHNLLVQLLVVGGLLAVVLTAGLLYLAWRQSLALARAGHAVPVLFLIALVHASWLEASHIVITLAGYLTWLPLFVIARLGFDPSRAQPQTQREAGEPAVPDSQPPAPAEKPLSVS
jgi:O-antigen/teichoic acid export membrane protein/O-antigen ligase